MSAVGSASPPYLAVDTSLPRSFLARQPVIAINKGPLRGNGGNEKPRLATHDSRLDSSTPRLT